MTLLELFPDRTHPGTLERMAEETERTMSPDTEHEARQAARERFRERLAAAEQRMSAPGAWERLREAHRAPRPTA